MAVTLAFSFTTIGQPELDSSLATANWPTPTAAGAPGMILRLERAAEASSCDAVKLMLLEPCSIQTSHNHTRPFGSMIGLVQVGELCAAHQVHNGILHF